MDSAPSDRAKKLLDLWSAMHTIRQPYVSVCQEVAKYFDPNIASLMSAGSDGGAIDPGEQDVPDIATFAMYVRFVNTAGIYSHTIGTGRRFFNLRDGNTRNNENEEVKRFFGEVSDQVLNRLQDSNFDVESIEAIDGAVYGTVILQRIFDKHKRTKYRTLPTYQCCISENGDGEVDTLFYEYQMSVDQIMAKWPDTASAAIVAAHEDPAKRKDQVKVYKCCYPRPEYNPLDKSCYDNPFKREYEVVYIEAATGAELEETGESDFPYIVSRVGKRIPGTPYARGLGIQALPTLRQLDNMLKDICDATEGQLKPVVFGPEGTDPADVDLQPGSWNPVMGPNDRPPLVWTPQADLGNAWNYFQELIQQIRNLFFTDMWLAMEQNRSDTATEAEIRQEEKFQSVTPVAIRWMKLFYSPIVKSEFRFISNEDLLETDVPEELGISGTYEVEYVTRLNSLLNAFENNMLMQTVEQCAAIFRMSNEVPQLKHVLKVIDICRSIAYNNNTDPDFVVTAEAAEKAIADEQAQIAQAEMQKEITGKITGMDLQKAPEEGSLMEMAANGQPQL